MGISVLMSVYAKENPEYFRAALESIYRQTKLPDEIVIIKDGRLTEELENVIASISERNIPIVTYQFEENVQLGRALAKGVELCQYDLIARMDTDDIACSDRLSVQYGYMKENLDVVVCGGWMEEFNNDGTYRKIKKMPITQSEILQYAKYRNPLNHMTVMLRKNAILKVGNYQHFPFLEDYYLWCRVIAQGSCIANVEKVLVNMRTNQGLYKRRGGWKYFRQYMQLRRKQRKMGLLTFKEYIIAVILTMGMTLQPTFLRRLLYQKVLRK